MWENILEPGKP